MPKPRPVLTASVSAEAYAGWARFAGDHDVTVTALVEAVGLALGAGVPEPLAGEVVAVARAVSSERRSRRR